jgi:hypothetical protein
LARRDFVFLRPGFYENSIKTGPHAGASDGGFVAGFPSEVEARSFCRASKIGKVLAKLVKSAKCAAIMIFFRQNRDVL